MINNEQMKLVLPAASMAAIIASTATLGVARGFNIAKHIARSRSASLASSRRFGSRASPFHHRTASSTCFIRPEESSILFSAPPAKESTSSSSSSAATPAVATTSSSSSKTAVTPAAHHQHHHHACYANTRLAAAQLVFTRLP